MQQIGRLCQEATDDLHYEEELPRQRVAAYATERTENDFKDNPTGL
jgi:hypothetical protein